MIRYALRCDRNHAFESWFQSAAAYDGQRKRKLVECPSCGSVKVEKAIMAPQIAQQGPHRKPAPAEATTPSPAPAPLHIRFSDDGAGARAARQTARIARPHHQERRQCRRQFPEEARKMHYGDIDHRPIYGEASPDEARAMIEEGVEVSPLPILPDDRN